MDSIAFFDKLEGFMQSKFGEKEPRECPECAKCSDASMPKYFASLGSLKQHLLEHYRVKYYLENHYPRTEGRCIPWHDDYDPISDTQLEKYMDKELFGDDLERFEDEREAQAEETERRMREEKKKRDRQSRQKKITEKDSKSIEPMKPMKIVKKKRYIFDDEGNMFTETYYMNEEMTNEEIEKQKKEDEKRKSPATKSNPTTKKVAAKPSVDAQKGSMKQKSIPAEKVEPKAKLHNEYNNSNSKSIEPMKPKEKLDKNLNSEDNRKKRKRIISDDTGKSNVKPKKRKSLNDITEKIDLTGLGLDLENLSVDEELGVSGEITAMNIQQTEYRFCPMCSKDKEGFQTDANLLAYQTSTSRAPSITLFQSMSLKSCLRYWWMTYQYTLKTAWQLQAKYTIHLFQRERNHCS